MENKDVGRKYKGAVWHQYFNYSGKKDATLSNILDNKTRYYKVYYPFLQKKQILGKVYEELEIPHAFGVVDRKKLYKLYLNAIKTEIPSIKKSSDRRKIYRKLPFGIRENHKPETLITSTTVKPRIIKELNKLNKTYTFKKAVRFQEDSQEMNNQLNSFGKPTSMDATENVLEENEPFIQTEPDRYPYTREREKPKDQANIDKQIDFLKAFSLKKTTLINQKSTGYNENKQSEFVNSNSQTHNSDLIVEASEQRPGEESHDSPNQQETFESSSCMKVSNSTEKSKDSLLNSENQLPCTNEGNNIGSEPASPLIITPETKSSEVMENYSEHLSTSPSESINEPPITASNLNIQKYIKSTKIKSKGKQKPTKNCNKATEEKINSRNAKDNNEEVLNENNLKLLQSKNEASTSDVSINKTDYFNSTVRVDNETLDTKNCEEISHSSDLKITEVYKGDEIELNKNSITNTNQAGNTNYECIENDNASEISLVIDGITEGGQVKLYKPLSFSGIFQKSNDSNEELNLQRVNDKNYNFSTNEINREHTLWSSDLYTNSPRQAITPTEDFHEELLNRLEYKSSRIAYQRHSDSSSLNSSLQSVESMPDNSDRNSTSEILNEIKAVSISKTEDEKNIESDSSSMGSLNDNQKVEVIQMPSESAEHETKETCTLNTTSKKASLNISQFFIKSYKSSSDNEEKIVENDVLGNNKSFCAENVFSKRTMDDTECKNDIQNVSQSTDSKHLKFNRGDSPIYINYDEVNTTYKRDSEVEFQQKNENCEVNSEGYSSDQNTRREIMEIKSFQINQFPFSKRSSISYDELEKSDEDNHGSDSERGSFTWLKNNVEKPQQTKCENYVSQEGIKNKTDNLIQTVNYDNNSQDSSTRGSVHKKVLAEEKTSLKNNEPQPSKNSMYNPDENLYPNSSKYKIELNKVNKTSSIKYLNSSCPASFESNYEKYPHKKESDGKSYSEGMIDFKCKKQEFINTYENGIKIRYLKESPLNDLQTLTKTSRHELGLENNFEIQFNSDSQSTSPSIISKSDTPIHYEKRSHESGVKNIATSTNGSHLEEAKSLSMIGESNSFSDFISKYKLKFSNLDANCKKLDKDHEKDLYCTDKPQSENDSEHLEPISNKSMKNIAPSPNASHLEEAKSLSMIGKSTSFSDFISKYKLKFSNLGSNCKVDNDHEKDLYCTDKPQSKNDSEHLEPISNKSMNIASRNKESLDILENTNRTENELDINTSGNNKDKLENSSLDTSSYSTSGSHTRKKSVSSVIRKKRAQMVKSQYNSPNTLLSSSSENENMYKSRSRRSLSKRRIISFGKPVLSAISPNSSSDSQSSRHSFQKKDGDGLTQSIDIQLISNKDHTLQESNELRIPLKNQKVFKHKNKINPSEGSNFQSHSINKSNLFSSKVNTTDSTSEISLEKSRHLNTFLDNKLNQTRNEFSEKMYADPHSSDSNSVTFTESKNNANNQMDTLKEGISLVYSTPDKDDTFTSQGRDSESRNMSILSGVVPLHDTSMKNSKQSTIPQSSTPHIQNSPTITWTKTTSMKEALQDRKEIDWNEGNDEVQTMDSIKRKYIEPTNKNISSQESVRELIYGSNIQSQDEPPRTDLDIKGQEANKEIHSARTPIQDSIIRSDISDYIGITRSKSHIRELIKPYEKKDINERQTTKEIKENAKRNINKKVFKSSIASNIEFYNKESEDIENNSVKNFTETSNHYNFYNNDIYFKKHDQLSNNVKSDVAYRIKSESSESMNNQNSAEGAICSQKRYLKNEISPSDNKNVHKWNTISSVSSNTKSFLTKSFNKATKHHISEKLNIDTGNKTKRIKSSTVTWVNRSNTTQSTNSLEEEETPQETMLRRVYFMDN